MDDNIYSIHKIMYFSKICYLFNREKKEITEKLLFDDISLYSVTRQDIADKMTRILSTLPDISSSSKLLDATACIGGNTFSFLKYFTNVTALEIDSNRFSMLSSNAVILNIPKQYLHLECTDCIPYLESLTQDRYPDIIFFDPPWGGTNYTNYSKIKLYLSGEPLENIIDKYIHKCKYIACKIPLNMDESVFTLPFYTYHFYKMKFIIFKNDIHSSQYCP